MPEETEGSSSGVRKQAANHAGLTERVEGLRRDLNKLEASCASGHESVDDHTQRELDEIRAFLWPSSGLTLREQIRDGDADGQQAVAELGARMDRYSSNVRLLGSIGFVLLAMIQLLFAALRVFL